jgi:hypothetical protein
VKSEASIVRCVVFVSVSVVSLICAYKFGRNQGQTDTLCKSQQPKKTMTLEEGQTILAVVDRPQSMRFYIGNDEVEGKQDA